ncbi:MAG: aldo/keto reductase [Gammaproteobacteria bacterium]|nr:aldo/keto reductase [Gammaproteobacteria bacterium]MCP5417756.1 aldo/keto reductase [Chromatiaceae bacterium]
MEYRNLGRSDLRVSTICLGTMTWGRQNTQADADRQLEYALARGINFLDTAEMYAIPPTAETYGTTETIIGNWLGRNPEKRRGLVLATKIAGNGLSWIRAGADVTGAAVVDSVDASLRRLQTDYIDLYQLHWPNRNSPHFGKHWPGRLRFSAMDAARNREQMLDILHGFAACIEAGKIRYGGLSDETPWGIQQYLQLSQAHDLPQMVSIQNEFNLLHTKDWPYLIEHSVLSGLAYLPWSPLAGGVLTGKYLNGARPPGSRWTISQRNGLFRDQVQAHQAIAAYQEVADRYGMSLATLALAWVNQQDGVTATIIGATSMEQLQEDIAAFDVVLSEEMLADILTVLKRYPLPF